MPMVQQSFATEPMMALTSLAMPPDTITLYGAGFIPHSLVKLDGVNVQTIFISPNTLKAIVPSGRSVGSYPVTVYNPALGGGSSAQQILVITSQADTSKALEFSYTLTQTQYQIRDSSRGGGTDVSHFDSALVNMRSLPRKQVLQFNSIVKSDGNSISTILDISTEEDNPRYSDVPTTQTDRPVKYTEIHSSTSTVKLYDAQGQLIAQDRYPVLSYKTFLDSLRAGSITNPLPVGNGNSMQQLLADAILAGRSTTNLGSGRFEIVFPSLPSQIYGIPIQERLQARMTINTAQNQMESIALYKDNFTTPHSTMYFRYSLGSDGAMRQEMMYSEFFYRLASGIPMKAVTILQYRDYRYTSYIRR
jgi:hypothetical protein